MLSVVLQVGRQWSLLELVLLLAVGGACGFVGALVCSPALASERIRQTFSAVGPTPSWPSSYGMSAVALGTPVPLLVELLEWAVYRTGPVGRGVYAWVPMWGTFGIYAAFCVVLAVAAVVRTSESRADYRTLGALTVFGVAYSGVVVAAAHQFSVAV